MDALSSAVAMKINCDVQMLEMENHMDYSVSFCGARFENPFVLSSAPPTATPELIRRGFESGWAGAVVKTIIREPVRNLRNRFAVMKQGKRIIGFENLELLSERSPEMWFEDIFSLKREFPTKIIIGSIMGDARSPEDWLYLARGCVQAGADMLELNFSCPHGYPERGKGAAIGQSAEYSALISGWLKQCSDIRIPVIPKLTAAVTDIQHIGEAVSGAGVDGICAINTVPSFFGIDLKTLRPKPDIGGKTAYGGYSGPGIKPLAMRAVCALLQSPGLPVMACGGIENGHDAAEFMLLGSPVVQVCTAVMLRGFGIIGRMREDFQEFMEWHGFVSCQEFIGKCRDSVTGFGGLGASPALTAVIDPAQCARCGSCWISCRDGGYQAISFDDKVPLVHKDKCAGCSLCSHVCPEGAITMASDVG